MLIMINIRVNKSKNISVVNCGNMSALNNAISFLTAPIFLSTALL